MVYISHCRRVRIAKWEIQRAEVLLAAGKLSWICGLVCWVDFGGPSERRQVLSHSNGKQRFPFGNPDYYLKNNYQCHVQCTYLHYYEILWKGTWIHISFDIMQMYCSMFEESRAIVSQKLSGRSKKIQDEWKRLCEKRNVVPGQQFHLLLSGRELSPEALRRKVRRIATPKRVTPSKLLKLFTVNNFITFLGHLGYWSCAVCVIKIN